jgi:hypothetical protein
MLVLLFLCSVAIVTATGTLRVTNLVNPVWATGGGQGFGGWGNQQRNPGAMSPFPMMRLGPDTTHVDPLFGEVLYFLMFTL